MVDEAVNVAPARHIIELDNTFVIDEIADIIINGAQKPNAALEGVQHIWTILGLSKEWVFIDIAGQYLISIIYCDN